MGIGSWLQRTMEKWRGKGSGKRRRDRGQETGRDVERNPGPRYTVARGPGRRDPTGTFRPVDEAEPDRSTPSGFLVTAGTEPGMGIQDPRVDHSVASRAGGQPPVMATPTEGDTGRPRPLHPLSDPRVLPVDRGPPTSTPGHQAHELLLRNSDHGRVSLSSGTFGALEPHGSAPAYLIRGWTVCPAHHNFQHQ